MLFLFLLVPIFLFLLINLIIYFSVRKVFSQKSDHFSEQKISIVVAAKNEERNIPALINALHNQDYNKNAFEVILVDDDSSDGTFRTASEHIKDKPNFSVIRSDSKLLSGKKGALAKGIEKTVNEFIMITDADCLPQKGWIRTYSRIFSEGYDFIFGAAPFFVEKTFINNLSCFENIRSTILTFASAAAGYPYSAAARNFGFRKTSFEKIKGYSNTMETLSGDDDLLLREAVKHRMKTGLAAGKDSLVFSGTKDNMADYIRQKARHTQTSLYYLPFQKFIPGFWHLLNFFFLLSPVLILVDSVFICFFLVKMITDIVIMINLQKYFGYRFTLSEIFYLQIVYEIFLVIHFFNALSGKSDWE